MTLLVTDVLNNWKVCLNIIINNLFWWQNENLHVNPHDSSDINQLMGPQTLFNIFK